MKLSVLPAILLTTTASIAQAGGFEAQTLDTGFMYEEGAVLTASTASLNSNLTEANGAKILKDQNFTSFSIKSKVGPLDVGLTTYRSGAIQMSGAASPIAYHPTQSPMQMRMLKRLRHCLNMT